jgi:hypothetical protein
MTHFRAEIKHFDQKGEKSGWRYIEVTNSIIKTLLPNAKKIFQVKGKLDQYVFSGASLLPMGDGTFILPINATMRKAIRKTTGASIQVTLELDTTPYPMNEDLISLLEEEPIGNAYFKSLAPSHQRYFSKWVDAAKTLPTKATRLAACIHALNLHWDYGTMIRAQKKT